MCGIAGLVLSPPGLLDGRLVESLLDGLAHRGPDDVGWLAFGPGGIQSGREVPTRLEAEVVLCCRRLSILDLSAAAHQPMSGAEGRLHLVHNGEIYNYLELREELERLGHRFRSTSDTEVLLAAYAEWGREAIRRLVGMFAFAVLDLAGRSLFLARDFIGMKPLYHTRWQQGLAFASEIGPLLELPGVSRRPDPDRLYRYLRFSNSDYGEGTMFADVAQLPAAHHAELSLDRPRPVEPVRYWEPSAEERTDLSFDEAAAELRERFLESVSLHLRSDVRVGFALSGGIDSSAIVMAARAELGDTVDLPTFSFLADDPKLDEERWIDVVAQEACTRQHKIRLGPHDLAADLDRLIELQGEPVVEPQVYAEYRVFGLAEEAGVKVIVNGQGADELLGGYNLFATARLASLVRQRRFVAAARFLRAASRQPRLRGARRIVRSNGLLLPPALREPARRLFDIPLMPPWLNGRWFAERGVRLAAPKAARGRDALRAQLVLHLTETKLPRLLRYGDRNSMTHSIESRLPFLTPSLASFILSLPEEYVIGPDGTSKAVFRRAMAGIVPPAVLERKDKIGFQAPVGAWMRVLRFHVDRILDGAEAANVTPLALDRVRADWRTWLDRGKGRDIHPFWRFVNVIRWADRLDVSFDDAA